MPTPLLPTLARYAVIGNPIAHSQSPYIHAAFAQQTQQHMIYEKLLAPIDGFVEAVRNFHQHGGQGLNVTVPFKLQACALANECSIRAQLAGAVNTLRCSADGQLYGDNTDGIGLVRDLTERHQCNLSGKRILLLGAGGAARGVIQPLLACQPHSLTIANRSQDKADALQRLFSETATAFNVSLFACALADVLGVSTAHGAGYEIVINATSSSLNDAVPTLPDGVYATNGLAYDMMYSAFPTHFMQSAQAQGATQIVDGLGMLVEQAAESFFCWRAVRPNTDKVYRDLRRILANQAAR